MRPCDDRSRLHPSPRCRPCVARRSLPLILVASVCLASPVWAEPSDRTEEVVRKGLDWLVATQSRRGSWSANESRYPTAMTALAGTALLMEGSWSSIASEFVSAVIGVVAVAASFQGWFLRPIGPVVRIFFFGAALLLITPGLTTNLSGLALFVALVLWTYWSRTRVPCVEPMSHAVTERENVYDNTNLS